jgi:hypothetical protein
MKDTGQVTGTTPRMLYLVISGAPAPEGLPSLVSLIQKSGWKCRLTSAYVLRGRALSRSRPQPVRANCTVRAGTDEERKSHGRARWERLVMTTSIVLTPGGLNP